MKEEFEKLKRKIEARKETVLPERNYMFGKLGVVSAEATNRTIDAALSIVSEVEAEYINKSTEHINKLRDCSTNWIDVKDQLPEKDGYYLTCDHKGNIHVFYHHPSYVTNGSNTAFGICKNHSQYYQPIAWMELPKPYKRKKGW